MSASKKQGGPSFVPGTLVAGKYRLIKALGEGAMGVVWSAVNEVTSGQVALKLIWKSEPEYRVRLLREAKACGTVRHKNVIQIHDVGQTEGGDPFLVMELLSGETLADLLARKRRLPPPAAAAIGRDVARALAAAHAKEIVHRDLKPANIFLHNEPGEDQPVVKVLDFGVAKNLASNDGLRTATGSAVGSPMYMSPEQASKTGDIDERADIWSLGVVLFEMLTGDRPFRGDLAEVLHQILAGEIPAVARRVRRIDPALDRIVAGCLVRAREDRLGPAAEIARLLEEHAAPRGGERMPPTLEDAPIDRGPGGAVSTSGSAPFSPRASGSGPTPTSSPGIAGSGVRPSSSSGNGLPGFERVPLLEAGAAGLGSALASPEVAPAGAHGPTEPLHPGQQPAPAEAPIVDDDEAATHRLDPRMLACGGAGSPPDRSPQPPAVAPLPGPGGAMGPGGTVRIDPAVAEEAILARGSVSRPAREAISSTAPMLALPSSPGEGSATAGPAPRRRGLVAAIAGAGGVAALATIVFVLMGTSESPTSPGVETAEPALPPPPQTASAMPTAVVPASPVTAAPAPSPSESPAPPVTASAPVVPRVSATPRAVTPKPGATPGAAAPKPSATPGAAAPKPSATPGSAASKPSATPGSAAPKPSPQRQPAPLPAATGKCTSKFLCPKKKVDPHGP